MDTMLLSGKEAARVVRARVKEATQTLRAEGKQVPKLAVIIVGQDPASETYVANKEKACGWTGIESLLIRLPEDTPEEAVLAEVDRLNRDASVTGILVQLPLPAGLCEEKILLAIDPVKDVDGFSPENVGLMWTGNSRAITSCTPAGIIELLKQNGIEIAGKRAVVCGRSNIVGKPMAALLLAENATVTVCHSKTEDLAAITREADILVAAIGKPKFFDASYIKEGAVVVDVGIHRTDDGLVGDVDAETVAGKAAWLSPVPGGVGPMTVAMLMENCLKAYRNQHQEA